MEPMAERSFVVVGEVEREVVLVIEDEPGDEVTL